MTRNTAREIATHLAYELSFIDLSVEAFLDTRLSEENFEALAQECEVYSEHAAELDTYIEKYAQGWRFERISLVASAIMRVAMFEILYMPDIPNGVAINEAVEIAKKYESPEVVRFMNGILGSFLREEVK